MDNLRLYVRFNDSSVLYMSPIVLIGMIVVCSGLKFTTGKYSTIAGFEPGPLAPHAFLSFLSPSLGDGQIWTEILSQSAVKAKTTNRPITLCQ